jgi:hypothetical protein
MHMRLPFRVAAMIELAEPQVQIARALSWFLDCPERKRMYALT